MPDETEPIPDSAQDGLQPAEATRRMGDSTLRNLFASAPSSADGGTQPRAAQAAEVALEKPGDSIGRYKLLEKIGEGGFGAVWRAEQSEPIRREVALKVIKAGMDSAEIIARFEAERQALALMDHPNIAGVLDAGATEGGRPFFAMELVKGVAITEYADAHKLTIRERLELFIPVCQAVQHAHQKAILHRDLKPSNILVTEVDGKPVPKVIDFGIAKALGTSADAVLQASILQTQAGMVVGTPQYMSPEQAGAGTDMDTRSDIYTLGVILYELLTGNTPLPREALRQAAFDEVLRLIREAEPKRPSSRAMPVTEIVRLTSVARGTEPAKLTRTLRGDLDWITLKALEKERDRRYGSAAALAQDIERHLNNEPVEAGAPSAMYRFRKLVRRNRLAFAASSAIVLLLIAGIAVSTWQWREAVQARGKSDDILTKMQLQRAEELFSVDDASGGLAYLAAIIRRHPEDRITASRLLSALRDRSYARPLLTQMKQGGTVRGMDWSPDGRRVATVTKDRIHVWDTASGKLAFDPIPSSPEADLVGVRFSPDGRRLVAIGNDCQVFDTVTGKQVTPPLVHQGRPIQSGGVVGSRWAVFYPNGRHLATATNLNVVKIWEVESGKETAGFDALGKPSDLLMSPDGAWLACGVSDGSIVLWNTASQRVEQTWKMPGAGAVKLIFSSDAKHLFAKYSGAFVLGFDLTTMEQTSWKITSPDGLGPMALSPDGNTLAIGTIKHSVRFYATRTGAESRAEWQLHQYVSSVDYSSDGTRIVIATDQPAVQVWDVVSNQPVCSSCLMNSGIESARLSRDGTRLAVGTAAGEIRLWDIGANEAQPLLFGPPSGTGPSAVSPDDSVFAKVTGSDVTLWNLGTGRRLGVVRHSSDIWALKFHPQQKQLFAGDTKTQRVRRWNYETGELAGPDIPSGGWACLNGYHFSADGRYLCMDSSGGPVRVWDLTMGKPVSKPFGSHVEFAQMTPDAKRVVGVEWLTSGVAVFDVDSGRQIGSDCPHGARVTTIVMSRDGQRFATGCLDGSVRVWNMADATPATPLMSHRGAISFWGSISFSPDGKVVATASHDRTAQLWSIPGGQPLCEPIQHPESVYSAQISPDGHRLATSSYDGSVRLWDVPSGRALSDRLPVHVQYCSHLTWTHDGNHLVGVGNGLSHSWEVPTLESAPPTWLADWAETIAGQRLNVDGMLKPAGNGEWKGIASRVAELRGEDIYTRTAKWFFARTEERPISPDSKIHLQEYLRLLCESASVRASMAALHIMPGDPRLIARNTETYMEPFNKLGDEDSSHIRLELDRAEQMNPREPVVWRARAELQYMTGETDAALASSRRAAELDPDDGRTQRQLGILLFQKGDYAGAIVPLGKALGSMQSSGYDRSMRKFLLSLHHDSQQKLGRIEEATSENMELHGIPSRDANAGAKQIDLSAFYNLGLEEDARNRNGGNPAFADIPHGLQTMSGIPFDIRGMIQLNNKDFPPDLADGVHGIAIRQSCQSLRFLHSCVRIPGTHGAVVAKYIISYEDGTIETAPVRAGMEIGNIYRSDGKRPAPPLMLGWMGETADTRKRSENEKKTITACLYEMIWQNPHPEKPVKSLDFVSADTEHAAPVLFAITAE